MSTIVIDVSELRGHDDKSLEDLAAFLEGQLDMTVALAKNEVTL